jgi:hypothetical protein
VGQVGHQFGQVPTGPGTERPPEAVIELGRVEPPGLEVGPEFAGDRVPFLIGRQDARLLAAGRVHPRTSLCWKASRAFALISFLS